MDTQSWVQALTVVIGFAIASVSAYLGARGGLNGMKSDMRAIKENAAAQAVEQQRREDRRDRERAELWDCISEMRVSIASTDRRLAVLESQRKSG